MGMRTFDLHSKTVWIEDEDLGKGNLRLKGFADLDIEGGEATVVSIDRSDNRPIIHWLSEAQSRQGKLIIAQDGEIIEHVGQMESHAYPEGTIVQLERIGYGRVIDETTILFSHS